MKLTDFQTKFVWGIGIFIILLIWMIFPLIFKQLISVYDLPENLKDFGAFGDIYGSLNTLISSIALCAIAFSTWLQVTSLKETREATERQLSELKNTRLTDQFYSLMTFKNEMLYQLNFKIYKSYDEYIEDADEKKIKNINAVEALKLLASTFKRYVELDTELKSSKHKVRLECFDKILKVIFAEEVNELVSYFYIYGELIKLVERADDEELRENLKSVLRNTMLQDEQIVLFWFASLFKEINYSLDNSEIFNKFHYAMYQKFALKFHKASHFKSESWKEYYKHNKTQPELGLFD